MKKEKWYNSYENKPELYDLFSKYEDFENTALKKLNQLTEFKDKIIIDIGCGTGKYASMIAPKCKLYYALDKYKAVLDIAKDKCSDLNNIVYLNTNSTNIPLKDNSVDMVFSSWGLSMVVIKETMNEVKRIVKPSGEMWTFGNYPYSEFMEMRGEYEIKRDEETMKILDKEYGLKVKSIVDGYFMFPSLEETKKICGYLFGDNALDYLLKNPKSKIKHKIIIQNKKF